MRPLVTLATFAICAGIQLPVECAAQAAGATQSHAIPAEYHEAVKSALLEYEARNFAEARALFQRAHAIFPNARTLRGLGMMEFELKNYPESVTQLQGALSSPVRPLEGELRAQTEDMLSRARAFVGRYRVVLAPETKAARVALDGVPVALPADRVLLVGVGEHVVEVDAAGYRLEKRALSVKGGEDQRLAIDLQHTRAAPPEATSTVSRREANVQGRDSLWESPWLWAGAGVAVAGGVIAALVVSSGGSDEDGVERGDVGGVVITLGSSR